MSDQAEQVARALPPRLLERIGAAVMRPFREVAARLKASLWLIVAVGVIMASLVLIAGLSKTFALIGVVSFVASVVLLVVFFLVLDIGIAGYPAMRDYGTDFVTTRTWDGNTHFGRASPALISIAGQ